MIMKKIFGKNKKITFVSTAWKVIRMIINEKFLNKNRKANLVAIETGLKIELDLISVQNLF